MTNNYPRWIPICKEYLKISCLNQFSQQKGGILSPTVYARVYPATNKLMSWEYLKNAPTSEQLALFTRNWSKLISSSMILDILKIYEITFLDLELFQVSTPPSVAMVQEEALLVDWEIQTLLSKGWIKLSSSSQNQYISPVFSKVFPKKMHITLQY